MPRAALSRWWKVSLAALSRRKSLAAITLGLLLVVGDAIVALARRYPAFIWDHLPGIFGTILVLAGGLAWLARRRRKQNDVEAVTDGTDLPFVKDNPVAVRALKWVAEQVDFYDHYGLMHANLYFWFKIPTIVAASLIPVFVLQDYTKTGASLGAAVAILEGILQMARYHDNWVAGISTRDQLQRERELFLTSARPYARIDEAAVALFSERVSVLMTQEQGKWLQSRQASTQNPTAAR